jgi:hypothetical protein
LGSTALTHDATKTKLIVEVKPNGFRCELPVHVLFKAKESQASLMTSPSPCPSSQPEMTKKAEIGSLSLSSYTQNESACEHERRQEYSVFQWADFEHDRSLLTPAWSNKVLQAETAQTAEPKLLASKMHERRQEQSLYQWPDVEDITPLDPKRRSLLPNMILMSTEVLNNPTQKRAVNAEIAASKSMLFLSIDNAFSNAVNDNSVLPIKDLENRSEHELPETLSSYDVVIRLERIAPPRSQTSGFNFIESPIAKPEESPFAISYLGNDESNRNSTF